MLESDGRTWLPTFERPLAVIFSATNSSIPSKRMSSPGESLLYATTRHKYTNTKMNDSGGTTHVHSPDIPCNSPGMPERDCRCTHILGHAQERRDEGRGHMFNDYRTTIRRDSHLNTDKPFLPALLCTVCDSQNSLVLGRQFILQTRNNSGHALLVLGEQKRNNPLTCDCSLKQIHEQMDLLCIL